MKIDRMIGILTILLRRRKMTATELAEIFEVSRRTIQRDIDALNQAGIPMVTEKGPNGGISIMADYQLDRTLITSQEMQAILTGLRSLDSVSGSHWYSKLMEKLKTGSTTVLPGDSTMLIDLASWYKGSLAPKLELIHKAIEQHEAIRFTYYSAKGESKRALDPYYLIFQWSSWYVWGWDREKEECRTYKLNRMEDVESMDIQFEVMDVPLPKVANDDIFPDKYDLFAYFSGNCKWKLIETYGRESFTEYPDGRLLFMKGFADWDYMRQWVLSFGADVEVLMPLELREELRHVGAEMVKRYS